jgi:3-deoxy-D-manno-octulosonic-acid transferase
MFLLFFNYQLMSAKLTICCKFAAKILSMSVLYNLFISIYLLGIRFASLFNEKAKLWLEGRKNIFKEIEKAVLPNDSVIWVHVASLGEFEQARPVIEKLKEYFPSHKILLTFFSPSGYEIRKNYDKADYVFYLPLDTKSNAKRFVRTVKPKLVIFVKYEFWYNYIKELCRNKIPLLMISVIFRPSQHFFKFYGRWFRAQLQKVTWFFVQNEKSLDLLNGIKVFHAEKSGDTRFDRVYQMVSENKVIEEVKHFKGDDLLMVAGSTWPPDEDILKYIIENTPSYLKIVIAPHEVNKQHISEIIEKFKAFSPVLFTDNKESYDVNSRVLIINTTGLLAYVYRYSDFSYVGGGFGVGIHNLLEPVTYGQPVIFGPNYQKFQEAHDLIEAGSGFSVTNKTEALNIVNRFLQEKNYLKELSEISTKYVKSNIGATEMVISKVKEYIIEPSLSQSGL